MPSPLSAARAAVLGAVLALLPASALPAPADDLPVLGDASSGIVSPEVEAMLGDDFLRQLRAQLPTRGDPLLHYWTEALLYRLAASSDLKEAQLKLVLIDAAPINAFAAPGGIVGIHFGTYAQAATVHEFSSILAHELAHLSQRHFARGVEAQRQASLPFLAAVLASAALMATVGGMRAWRPLPAPKPFPSKTSCATADRGNGKPTAWVSKPWCGPIWTPGLPRACSNTWPTSTAFPGACRNSCLPTR